MASDLAWSGIRCMKIKGKYATTFAQRRKMFEYFSHFCTKCAARVSHLIIPNAIAHANVRTTLGFVTPKN